MSRLPNAQPMVILEKQLPWEENQKSAKVMQQSMDFYVQVRKFSGFVRFSFRIKKVHHVIRNAFIMPKVNLKKKMREHLYYK